MRYLPAWIIIAFYTFVAALTAIPILGSQNFYSYDLAGHIALVLRMAANDGVPWFYDRAWFSGFAAFEFYGFVPHWIASQLLAWFGGGWTGATRAVHAVIAASIVLLPFSCWWFARGWQLKGGADAWVLAGGVVVVLALFLTVVEPETPAGIRFIVTGGVFGQLPGWVLMFLYLGVLGRALARGRTTNWPLVLSFSLVMATHPLTAVGALLVGLVLLASYAGWRATVAHGVAMAGTSAWFWLPVVIWSSKYGAGAPYSGDATLLSLLMDGWLDVLNGLSVSAWVLLAELLIMPTLAAAISFAIYRSNAMSRATLLLLLVGLFLAGTELTEAFFLGLHYDRLVVLFAVVTALMAVVAVTEALPALPKYSNVVLSGVLLCVGTQVTLVSLGTHPWLSSSTLDGYYEEQRLLQHLQNLPEGSRIFLEYAKQRSDRDVEPGKLVQSKLWNLTGQETVNGVLIQSSRPFQFYTTGAAVLGGEVFGITPIDGAFFTLKDEGITDLFRRNSITHVVSSNDKFTRRLMDIDGIRRVATTGRYGIHVIEDPREYLVPIEEPVIGYVDLKGNLPFRYMDMFVEFRESLSGRIRLVSLAPDEINTVPVDGLIINMDRDSGPMDWRWIDRPDGKRVPALGIHFDPSRRPRLDGRTNKHEKRQYTVVAEYLWSSEFEHLVHAFANREIEGGPPGDSDPKFEWSNDNQQVNFTNLSPGEWYEFAYSFFPAWRADNAVFRRGSAGHWLFRATEPNVQAEYYRWGTPPVFNGWLITISALLLLSMMRFWWPRWEIGQR
jgi:hypothetical protein